MKDLYVAVKEALSRVNFEKIWPGWTKQVPFALVGKDQVYLDGREAPLGDRYWANTVIDYEGKPLATWCVDDPSEEDVELLASYLAHEMFHAFQNEHWNGCHADELTLLSYPDNLTAYRIKAAEINLLLCAYNNCDREALADFVSLRKSRVEIIGNAITEEFLVEKGEGTAEFAGICALLQLSPSKYDEHIQLHLQTLKNPGEKLFSVRHMSYYTGAVLCLTLQKLGIDFHQPLSGGQSLFDVISAKDSTADAFEKYYVDKKARFDSFMATGTKTIKKNAYMTGFDPMNMWRMGDRILCTRFVSLDGENITGPVVLNMAPGSANRVESVITVDCV